MRALLALALAAASAHGEVIIALPPAAHPLEVLAAQELRRVIYSSKNRLCAIVRADAALAAADGVGESASPEARQGGIQGAGEARQERSVLAIGRAAAAAVLGAEPEELALSIGDEEGAHAVRTLQRPSAARAHVIALAGRSPQATLFAVYTFAEEALGAQFLLSGDVFPPREEAGAQAPLHFAPLDLAMSPSFRVRGIQPFHDFTSGPDWWSGDDYKVVMAQLTKMKANFIGLHSYPGGDAEPLVWLGDPKYVKPNGDVLPAGAYPTGWRTTLDSNWGNSGMNTSNYSVGAALAYPGQCYGSPAMMDTQPFCMDPALPHPPPGEPDTGAVAEAATINAAANLVADAFRFGGKLGVLRAVGTEVPLGMKGCHNCKNSLPPGLTHEQALEGAFTRLQRKFGADGLDYYCAPLSFLHLPCLLAMT